jgi:23S rRNA (pseudouridine1915-N3)-methyltransferase
MDTLANEIRMRVDAGNDKESKRSRDASGIISAYVERDAMRIYLIAIGNRMPRWVQQGYEEYARRMPPECKLLLKEVVPGKRGKQHRLPRVVEDEGKRLLAAIPPASHIVALDAQGRSRTTEQVAQTLSRWQQSGQDVSLLIGGPDGLSDACKSRAADTWSLSRLTFPHALVRIVVVEQIYRAWTLLHNHPYHRSA